MTVIFCLVVNSLSRREWLDRYDLIDDWDDYQPEYDGENGSGVVDKGHDEF